MLMELEPWVTCELGITEPTLKSSTGCGVLSSAGFVANVVVPSALAVKRVVNTVNLSAPNGVMFDVPPQTGFMRFGDRVRMAAHTPEGRQPFGVIDQQVVQR